MKKNQKKKNSKKKNEKNENMKKKGPLTPFRNCGGHGSVNIRKTRKSRSGSTKKACCLRHIVSRICFSPNCTSQKSVFFRNFGPPHFCTVFSTILSFWDPLAHFEIEGGRNFGSGYVSQNSRFYHVLSCLCGVVGVCGECHLAGHVVINFYTRGDF